MARGTSWAIVESRSLREVIFKTPSEGLDHGALLHTAHPVAIVLQECDELALGFRIPLDIALGHRQTGMAGEFLHVPQTPANL